MIKKIHYVWGGCPEPDVVKRNVESWAKLNPDFEIVKWDETNINIDKFAFAQSALESKKWAFVSDVVRLQALITQGGFYLDTDVELVSPLSRFAKRNPMDKLSMGYMYDCALGTAVIYSPVNHPYIKEVSELYHRIKPDFWPVNNSIFTAYFVNQVDDFLLNGKKWENDKAMIFPKEFFEQPAFIKKRGVGIHHCWGSWATSQSNISDVISPTSSLAYWKFWLKRKVRTHKSLRGNEFYPCYQAALKGQRRHFCTEKFFQEEPVPPLW